MRRFSWSVLLLAPFAHRAGHFGTLALALADALSSAAVPVRIIPSLPLAGKLTPRQTMLTAKTGAAWTWLLTRAGSHKPAPTATTGARTLEVLCVMVRALSAGGGESHTVFHFIDATFLLLAAWVLLTRRPTVYYFNDSLEAHEKVAESGAGPRALMSRLRLALLKRAARSGRFRIACETTHVQASVNRILGPIAHLIPYAVHPGAVSPAGPTVRARFGIPENAFVALLFGTHREGKDYRTVIDAAKLAGAPVMLFFVGAVISSNDPQKLAVELGLAQARFVNEFVEEESVPSYFAAADAVVLPYDGDFTRGSGVLLEACRFQRPLIVADTGHLAEFVRQYGCGFLFKQKDAASLARVFEEARSLDQASRDRLRTGLKTAAEEHSWSHAVNDYINLYEILLEKKE